MYIEGERLKSSDLINFKYHQRSYHSLLTNRLSLKRQHINTSNHHYDQNHFICLFYKSNITQLRNDCTFGVTILKVKTRRRKADEETLIEGSGSVRLTYSLRKLVL
jgi:hypothetical protein